MSDLSTMEFILTFPEPEAVVVNPTKTLLQIVDMQEWFVGTKETRKGWNAKEYIANLKTLLDTARDLEMVVVYQYSTSIPNPYEKTTKRTPVQVSFGPIIDEIKPIFQPVYKHPKRKDRLEYELRNNEYIVSKTGHDIFFHTHMDDLLAKLPDIDTAIVTGTATSGCVFRTVIGYENRGYRVIVPMDACITGSAERQALALAFMEVSGANYPATMTLSHMLTFER